MFDKVKEQFDKDPHATAAIGEQLAPIIDQLVEEKIEELKSDIETRFTKLSEDWVWIITNSYAVNDILLDKKVCTEDELAERMKEAHKRIIEMFHEKVEKGSNEPDIKV